MKEFKVSKIELSINFAHDYPFRPPFVRVVAPVIQRGYVLSGGAICLELLTEEGWSSAYSMESVIMQIGASLVKVGLYKLKNTASYWFYTEHILGRGPYNSKQTTRRCLHVE